MVALAAVAVDHLSLDADDGAPPGGQVVLAVGVAGEVELAGLAEVLEPLAGSASVLTDGDELVGLDVMDGSVVAGVKVLKVGVELVGNHGDLALNGVVDAGKLAADGVLAVVDGKVGRGDDLTVSVDLLDVKDKLAVELDGDGDGLSVSLVGV